LPAAAAAAALLGSAGGKPTFDPAHELDDFAHTLLSLKASNAAEDEEGGGHAGEEGGGGHAGEGFEEHHDAGSHDDSAKGHTPLAKRARGGGAGKGAAICGVGRGPAGWAWVAA
jgi:hypothetical protein